MNEKRPARAIDKARSIRYGPAKFPFRKGTNPMKKFFLSALVLVAAFAVTASAVADRQLVQFKAGDIDMTVLASDGVTPLADASIKLLSPEDASVLSQAVADQTGRAVVSAVEGRYLLNVSDVTLAVMDVSADASVTSARVVVPAASMLVAGQEAEGAEGEGGASLAAWVIPAGIVGAAAILVPTGFIIHNNTGGNHHHGNATGEEPAPAPVKRPHQGSQKPVSGN